MNARLLVAVPAALVAAAVALTPQLTGSSSIWPEHGQAALAVTVHGRTTTLAHAVERPAPIASMTKVMTAYLVLRAHPLARGDLGYPLTIRPEEVADTRRRAALGQSVVAVRAGEQLTERAALEALLLPSANNIAAVLARREAGDVPRFVRRMNAEAGRLGMSDTRYTDPSGYDERTTSTAADQVKLARAAMAVPAFAALVAERDAVLPYVGRVRNTDTLLGHHGFVGIKTGSLASAGGCFMFQNERVVDGRRVRIVGVVMGQPGRDLVDAGLRAADVMVTRMDRRLRAELAG